MKHKSKVISHFNIFKVFVENQLPHKIKIFRIDGRKEFCNQKFKQLLGNSGVIHQITCPYTP